MIPFSWIANSINKMNEIKRIPLNIVRLGRNLKTENFNQGIFYMTNP